MAKQLFSKIMLTIYLLVTIGLVIWGYTIFKDRNGKITTPKIPQENSNISSYSAPTDQNYVTQDNQQPSDVQTDQNQQSELIPKMTATDSFAKITSDMCDNECKGFKDDKNKLEYCQQVCGFNENTNKTEDSDCSNLNGLNKDYCLKNSAILKHDLKVCSDISDANLQRTCFNRVYDDLLEIEKQQNPSPNQAPEF